MSLLTKEDPHPVNYNIYNERGAKDFAMLVQNRKDGIPLWGQEKARRRKPFLARILKIARRFQKV